MINKIFIHSFSKIKLYKIGSYTIFSQTFFLFTDGIVFIEHPFNLFSISDNDHISIHIVLLIRILIICVSVKSNKLFFCCLCLFLLGPWCGCINKRRRNNLACITRIHKLFFGTRLGQPDIWQTIQFLLKLGVFIKGETWLGNSEITNVEFHMGILLGQFGDFLKSMRTILKEFSTFDENHFGKFRVDDFCSIFFNVIFLETVNVDWIVLVEKRIHKNNDSRFSRVQNGKGGLLGMYFLCRRIVPQETSHGYIQNTFPIVQDLEYPLQTFCERKWFHLLKKKNIYG